MRRRSGPRLPGYLLLAWVALGCRSPAETPEAGALLLRLSLAPGAPAPDELRVSVFDDGGALWLEARIPGEGTLKAGSEPHLGSILIQPGETSGVLRVHVRALAAGARVAGGVLSVSPGMRGSFDLTLDPALPTDEDADGVPDPIDDCPGRANPNQGGCPGGSPDATADASPSDGGDAGATPDGSPDAAPCGLTEGCGKANGMPCQDPAACSSGLCADGVCCATACEGVCRSCNQPGADGTCLPYATASDPERECSGGAACNGAGACGAAPPPASKQNGELCGGAGECLSGFCKDGVCCNSACTDPCQSCSSGTCAAVTRGADAPECVAPMQCNPRGRCVRD